MNKIPKITVTNIYDQSNALDAEHLIGKTVIFLNCRDQYDVESEILWRGSEFMVLSRIQKAKVYSDSSGRDENIFWFWPEYSCSDGQGLAIAEFITYGELNEDD